MCKWGTNEKIKLAYPRPNSGLTEICVDKCIASLIQILNDYKIHTLGCCCGHNKSKGVITIAKDSFEIDQFGNLTLFTSKDKPSMTKEIYHNAIKESKGI